MSILGKLFGSDKARDDILDKDNGLLAKTGGWIGNWNYTEEEKAEMAMMIRRWAGSQLQALHPFKVVQRILVFAIMFQWVLGGLMFYFSLFLFGETSTVTTNGVPSQVYTNAINDRILEFLFSNYVFWPTTAAVALYLTGGLLPNRDGKEDFKSK